jgi:multidrug resistance efflux pump
MEKQDLHPIPIPPRQHLREFQVIYLPVATFVFLVVLIGWMWLRYVSPATIVGEVETVRSKVVSVVAGTVLELKVDRLSSVTNGQPLVVIGVRGEDQLNADLAAAEADLRLMKARMDLDRVRNVSSYSQLRAELQVERLNHEIARIHLVQAESELERTKKLYDEQLLARGSGSARNDFGYDVALRDRDALRAEVAARAKVVAELEAGVNRLQAVGAAELGETDVVVERAVAAERQRLGHDEQSIVLRSPINGFVSVVDHLPGEKVVAGETILVVSAEKSDRILAWVRQPVTARPKVGDLVEVRRGVLGESPFQAVVVKVGRQLEQINPTAVPLAATIQQAEFGLPLVVKAPDVVDLIPGEAVQMHLLKRSGKAPTN